MDLTHEFTVPTGLDETWAAFNDIASVAQCFPGAVVTGVEGDSFEGSVKVKLGPIALVYNGAGHFAVKDEATHTMKVEAKGKDKRGNGTAGADVDLTMVEGTDGTTVTVVTDLAITGKPAQFGRGMIQDVSDKLLGQFVECLRTTSLSAGDPPAETVEEAVEQASVGGPVPSGPGPSGAPVDDSLDLGAAVLPVLAKSYGKQVAAALGVLALVVWIVRRRN